MRHEPPTVEVANLRGDAGDLANSSADTAPEPKLQIANPEQPLSDSAVVTLASLLLRLVDDSTDQEKDSGRGRRSLDEFNPSGT